MAETKTETQGWAAWAEAPPAPLAPVIVGVKPWKSPAERAADKLKTIEDELLADGLKITQAYTLAPDVAADPIGLERELSEKYGPKEARRLIQVAMDARENAQHKPAYLELVAKMSLGIMKARASEKAGAGGTALNVQINFVGAPSYPTQDIEPDEK